MAYLRRLFMAVTIAVQLVTLTYAMVVMGQSKAFDADRSVVNSTDARAVYYLAAVTLILTLGLGVVLWYERRGPSRRRGAAEAPIVGDGR